LKEREKHGCREGKIKDAQYALSNRIITSIHLKKNRSIIHKNNRHMGGDPIRTKDCQFITFLTLPNGTVIRHVQTPTSPLARSETPVLMGQYTYSRGPHLTDPQKYAYPCNPQNDVTLPNGWVVYGYTNTTAFPEGANYAWFGQAVWLPGDVARTYNNGYTANFLGLVANSTSPTSSEIDLLKQCVERNCKLDIKLLHVPSGKYILDKTITLQG
jgi:hypothetical protein